MQKAQKKKIWQALGIFAGLEICSELNGQNIDALDNIIILQHDNHVAFRKMDLWFTADETHCAFPFYAISVDLGLVQSPSILH